ncbi:MAG TPA: thioesterase family protein [Kofleriaceae bacterium]|nr:thioesterase family protein [Kofleriaceae bacterium]
MTKVETAVDAEMPESGSRNDTSLKQGGTAERSPAADTDATPGGNPVTSGFLARLNDPVRFRSTHHARFAELDPFGHLNTNSYLGYFTENRFIGHRDCLKLDLKAMMRFGIEPHIRKADLDFIRPVLLDQEFTVESYLSDASLDACTVPCTMVNDSGKLLATCTFHIVCVDKKTRRPCKWPENFLRLFYHQLLPE